MYLKMTGMTELAPGRILLLIHSFETMERTYMNRVTRAIATLHTAMEIPYINETMFDRFSQYSVIQNI